MILLCECEWIFSHFLRFCAGTREYFEKNSIKNRIVGEKNFGESRTGGAAALSRELSESFGPKLFSCNAKAPGKNFPDRTDSQWESVKKFPRSRRPPEKISQTAMRIVRGRLLDPVPPPPPGKWAPDPLGPLWSESVSGWWDPRPAAGLGLCGGGSWSPATAYAWKKCCEQVCAIS